MPHLSDLWSEVSQQRQDVSVLAVNIGDAPDFIRRWWEQEGFRHEAVTQDGRAVSAAFGVRAYPTNIVIGPDGTVAYAGVGYDEPALRRALGLPAR